MFEHLYKTRVYYAETDAAGVVHHANYLILFERARTEALRETGYTLVDLASEHDTVFAIRHIDIDYRAPLRLDDEIDITTRIINIRATNLLYEQHIRLSHEPEVVRTRMLIKIAAVGKDFKPRPLPERLIAEFEK